MLSEHKSDDWKASAFVWIYIYVLAFIGSQISSPKLRQNCKQPPPQPSPTAQHKYNLYPGVGNQQSGNVSVFILHICFYV